jgi:acetyl esterase/lipase
MKFVLLIGFIAMVMQAAGPQAVPLWPAAVPGDTAKLGEEHDATKPTDDNVAGRRLIRLTNVSVPTLTVYPAPKATATGAAVVVFPGGGYQILALDLEGTEVCQWLNSIGVTAVLVKYRVPRRAGLPYHAAPLQDAQRAVSLTRSHAAEWGIDPKRIGVLGFSAGGHLAAAVSNNFSARTYPAVDAADQVNSRPDFTILVYPAYLNGEKTTESVAPEVAVTSRTPKTFIVQAEDDKSFIRGTLIYYRTLLEAGVSAEIHVYPLGGHGYGLRPGQNEVTNWPKRAQVWMRSQGIIPGAKTE